MDRKKETRQKPRESKEEKRAEKRAKAEERGRWPREAVIERLATAAE